ncbi:MAG: hypothetical protein U1B30_15940 [Pseudomonadota bacterium]|nr:hypothetical protein [Pseudomonadota bacterium]
MKQVLKAKGLEEQRRLRYPRKHSFLTLIKMLENLGLVEPTGETGAPEGPSAGIVGDSWNFHQRRWLRLTPGAENSPAWGDPVGHYLFQYPETFAKMRPHGLSSPAAPAPFRERVGGRSSALEAEQILAPSGEAVTSRRGQRALEITPSGSREAALQLGDLPEIYSILVKLAEDVSQYGRQPENFQNLLDMGRPFQLRMKAVFPRAAFGDLDEGLDIQDQCLVALKTELAGGLPQRIEAAVRFCRASAARLAVYVSRLNPTSLASAVASAPAPLGLREHKLPEKPTARAVARLVAYLEEMQTLQNESAQVLGPVRLAMARLVPQLADWELEISELVAGSSRQRAPSEREIERWEAQQEVLEATREALESAGEELDEEASGDLDDPVEVVVDLLGTAIDELGNWE